MNENINLNRKWTKNILYLTTFFSLLVFLSEVASYQYLKYRHMISGNLLIYCYKNLIIPASIDILIISLGFYIINNENISISKRSFFSLVTITLTSCNYMTFHHQSPLAILSLVLPVVLSTLFGNSKITFKISALCTVISICIFMMIFSLKLKLGYDYMFNLLTAFIFIIILVTSSYFMTKLSEEKYNLLLSYIKERDYYYDRAMIDGLTRCYNHAAYDNKLKEVLKNKGNVSLAIVDIDLFKKVNDTYGHAVGDIVLKYLAKTLNKLNSKEIFVTRYGGEEFAIIFENHNEKETEKIMQKVKKTFTSKEFTELDNKSVTFSCGISSKIKHDTPKTIFNKADQALYKAKEDGRNRIVIYK